VQDWTKDERSEARVGNWRDFGAHPKKKQKIGESKEGWRKETRVSGGREDACSRIPHTIVACLQEKIATGEELREEKRTSHLTDYRKAWK
jgi:hypothetical protein